VAAWISPYKGCQGLFVVSLNTHQPNPHAHPQLNPPMPPCRLGPTPLMFSGQVLTLVVDCRWLLVACSSWGCPAPFPRLLCSSLRVC
jgi:hypothetical protein